MTLHHTADLKDLGDFLQSQKKRETRLRRALQRILSAAEGNPRFEAMNWTDVAEVARDALNEYERPHSAAVKGR